MGKKKKSVMGVIVTTPELVYLHHNLSVQEHRLLYPYPVGSLRRTGQVTIKLCKVEVIANSSKFLMLPHRVLEMPLTEGMH